jgi:hypothetical protein
LAKWKSLSLTLPDWNEKFFLATSAPDNILPASSEAIEIQEEFYRTKALNFKTPAKPRFETNKEQDTPTLKLDVRPYSPFFRSDEDAPITEIDHVAGVLVKLDEQGVANNNEALLVLTDDYRLEHRKAGDAILSLWLCMEALSAALGTALARLALAYMAPSAWASIGAMAANLDPFGFKLGLVGTTLAAFKLEINMWCEASIKASQELSYKDMEDFKMVFIGATRALSGQLDNIKLSLSHSPSQTTGSLWHFHLIHWNARADS